MYFEVLVLNYRTHKYETLLATAPSWRELIDRFDEGDREFVSASTQSDAPKGAVMRQAGHKSG